MFYHSFKGVKKTSPNYVHRSCSDALAANDDAKKEYLIQPSLKRGPVLVVCERGSNDKSYAVFHHDKEAEVEVDVGTDACGSNVYRFTYSLPFESIYSVLNFSNYCQQKTTAKCYGVMLVGRDCTWLMGRNNMKVDFWGGGPQNGTGCACGITGECRNPLYKCNCDANINNELLIDEGYVTAKGVLPLTGITIGDVEAQIEVLKFTIGPLRCIF